MDQAEGGTPLPVSVQIISPTNPFLDRASDGGDGDAPPPYEPVLSSTESIANDDDFVIVSASQPELDTDPALSTPTPPPRAHAPSAQPPAASGAVQPTPPLRIPVTPASSNTNPFIASKNMHLIHLCARVQRHCESVRRGITRDAPSMRRHLFYADAYFNLVSLCNYHYYE